jgi:hypothetical protein
LCEAEIEKCACGIRPEHRVAAEHAVLEHAGEGPGDTAIGGVSIAGLSKFEATLSNCRQPIAILRRSFGSTLRSMVRSRHRQ